MSEYGHTVSGKIYDPEDSASSVDYTTPGSHFMVSTERPCIHGYSSKFGRTPIDALGAKIGSAELA